MKEGNWRRRIKEMVESEVQENTLLHSFSTFRIGGPADLLVFPSSRGEICKVLVFTSGNGIPFKILGRGSNILVSDNGLRGVVMVLGNVFSKVSITGNRIECEAGMSLPQLSKITCEKGLSGLEFAAGIPGSVGGAVRMNAGTRETEIKDVLREVVSIDNQGRLNCYEKQDLQFSYRNSIFKKNDEIVVGAFFDMIPKDPIRIQEKIKTNLEYRINTQPLGIPSAGSIFKNPVGDFAGRLLGDGGCFGMRCGDALVSEKHPNWIINAGNARAADIWDLIKRMRKLVCEKTGVNLQLEIELLGNGFLPSVTE